MADEIKELPGIQEQLKKLNFAMFDEQGKVETIKTKVLAVETDVKWQGKEIKDVKGDLKDILENTTWIKRAFLTALIGSLSTGIIGGAIALIWMIIGK